MRGTIKGAFLKEIPLNNPKELFLPKTAVFGKNVSRICTHHGYVSTPSMFVGDDVPYHFTPLPKPNSGSS
jgi:hypothetical protein